ncbi:MAG: glycosyltransferase family 4 protein [Chloroflexia bacterium]
MKIALISLYLPSGSKGGVGYQAHYMANALVCAGHAVTVFTPCDHSRGALYSTVTVDVGSSMRTFRFAWELRKIDFSQFDVVHAHGDDYWLWNCGRPHIRTMHGSCFAEALHIGPIREKIRMAALGISEVLATIVADRTICVSRNTLRYFPWLDQVVLNGVDLEAFYPAAAKDEAPTLLFVGTYHNRKRGKMLMDVFSRVIRPELPTARLWMVCDDAPNAPGVTVFGSIPLDQLAELYRRAWVFCLPSTYEGFGVPYIEAMASGTAVVATPNVGAREVLCNGEYGILAEDSDLSVALLNILKVSSERIRYEELGLKRAQDFKWPRIIRDYERVYGELISIKQASEQAQVATT